MSYASHCLIVSDDDDFREELVERAVSLRFSVKAIRQPDELLPMLQKHAFGWLVLDLGMGEKACLRIVGMLGADPEPPRTILIAAADQALVDAVRLRAGQDGLDVGGVLCRSLASAALGDLLQGQDVDPAELEANSLPTRRDSER